MLFHIKHTHSWEPCPYHDADRSVAVWAIVAAVPCERILSSCPEWDRHRVDGFRTLDRFRKPQAVVEV